MRATRSRRRRDVMTIWVLMLAFAAFLIAQYALGGGLLGVSGDYTVKALVPTSAQLIPNANVTMSGAYVGRVESVSLRGDLALVTMKISTQSVTPIPDNSRVAVLMRDPLGENYVAITPGNSRKSLPSGGVLPATQANQYVDLDQILSLLNGKTKTQAEQFIQSMGGALEGRGQQLNDTLSSSAQLLARGSDVTQVLYRSRTQLGRLVPEFDQLMDAIGERGDAVRVLAKQGFAALSAVASRDNAIRQTLNVLPSTLSTLRTASNVLQSTTGRIAPLFVSLAQATRELKPAIESLQPASTAATQTLSQLSAASKPLQGTFTDVRQLEAPAVRALPQLRQLLCQTNPALTYLTPYAPEIIGTLGGLGSASNGYDASSHIIRLAPLSSDDSLPGLPPQVESSLNTLENSGLFAKTTGFGWDPYPPPGALTDRTRGLGIVGPSQWKGTYPHVVASC